MSPTFSPLQCCSKSLWYLTLLGVLTVSLTAQYGTILLPLHPLMSLLVEGDAVIRHFQKLLKSLSQAAGGRVIEMGCQWGDYNTPPIAFHLFKMQDATTVRKNAWVMDKVLKVNSRDSVNFTPNGTFVLFWWFFFFYATNNFVIFIWFLRFVMCA